MRNKKYVIRKFIMAQSAEEALKREKHISADDVWIDEDWKKEHSECTGKEMGFKKDVKK